jgi:plasmid stabilization system protein ParE
MFTVRWIPTALNDLAAIRTAANSGQRQAITRASHAIDAQLANDPLNVGQARPQGRRVLLATPLGVTYIVDTASATVRVLRVWYSQPNGHP